MAEAAGTRVRGAAVAFMATLDPDRSHAFYSGVLGLRHLERTPFANVYRVGGATLRVTLAQA